MPVTRALVLALAVAATAAGCDQGSKCGPSSAVVTRVVDGDTVELDTGEKVRYLCVNTPEISPPAECFGSEAAAFNRDLVEGKEVTLEYDVECRDMYDRLLAFVRVGGQEVNSVLVERGYARVLIIAPNCEERGPEFEQLEIEARNAAVGLWGTCQ